MIYFSLLLVIFVSLEISIFVEATKKLPYPWQWEPVQSPIDIYMDDAEMVKKAKPLKMHGYWRNEGHAYLENTGRTAEILFKDRIHLPYVSGGLLPKGERYIFEQMHFHWGETDDHGSEHALDGELFSMEAHLVHFNKKYHDFETALNYPDGLLVIAFFIEADGNKENTAFSQITSRIGDIQQPHSNVSIEADCLRWIGTIPQSLKKHYFVYHGSLTTPNYNEDVSWHVFPTPFHMSHQQVAIFRTILSESKTQITNNYRPIQYPTIKPTIAFVESIENCKNKKCKRN